MKWAMTGALLCLVICGLAMQCAAGDRQDNKPLAVGKGGLKIDAAIGTGDKRHNYKVTLVGKQYELELRMKAYRVTLDADKKYFMTVEAEDEVFDPLLVVLDEVGKILAYDDDDGVMADGDGKYDCKLNFTSKRAGSYSIHVAGMRDTIGAYRLKIIEAKK